MDENPVSVKLAVNGRYPDGVPLSTVPPQVLQTLPKLTEDLDIPLHQRQPDHPRLTRPCHRRLHRRRLPEVTG